MKLQIFSCGGTIDKVYFDDLSDYQVGEPVVGGILQRMHADFAFDLESLMRKDSLHMDDADRQLIRRRVADCTADCVLITHGTDGMVETARWLADIPGKCIVLTGAMQPAAFAGSDAVFNIGCAIGAVQSTPAGVYIAMSGRVFDATKVRKNRDQGCFESLPGVPD
jgi:L-asparaginase